MKFAHWGVFTLAAMAAAGLLFGGVAQAEEHQGDPFPLKNCPVMDSGLDSMGGPVKLVHEGREIRFCCQGCIGRFEDNAEAFLEEVDAAIVDSQLAVYPMENCIVADRPLGDSPVNVVVNNRLFRTCCAGCAAGIQDDAEGYFEKLDAAVKEAQADSYALETCPVSGQELGSMGDPVELVIANRLVKLCCAGCEAGVEENPADIIEQVDESRQG